MAVMEGQRRKTRQDLRYAVFWIRKNPRKNCFARVEEAVEHALRYPAYGPQYVIDLVTGEVVEWVDP